MAKKALAVISFGTSLPEARCAIEALEQHLAQSFPDYDFYRAFTSGMILRKIKKEEHVQIDTPEELLERLAQNGYEEVLCQSLHIINGDEFEKLHQVLAAYRSRFAVLQMGRPLLTKEADYSACMDVVLHNLPQQKDEALVLMGHGTGHYSNSAYCQLENTFHFYGFENVYVATVEGFPRLDYVMQRLQKKGFTRVVLAPFMVVAGEHAQVDLAGDGADSWKTRLQEAGYEVRTVLKGLGNYAQTAELFLEHAKTAQPI